jgi:hypothetical protein
MNKCLLTVAITLATLFLFVSLASGAEGGATWRFEPALAPPPPPGVPPSPYPVPVGPVGEISFWSPNRGLLIASGGLYAYNGENWHELATVCGGARGRIAWAGPDEFWTISDQRAGQQLPPAARVSLQSISLCHFLDGQVVGSYAMPLEQPDSYLPMDAAACYGPSDCWFGGADGSPPNGAFHLHWDGSTVSVVYGPEDHAITGMVNFAGQLFESVSVGANEIFLPPESPSAIAHPPVIHRIAAGEAKPTFENEVIFGPIGASTAEKQLPEYGKSVPPWSVGGFTLTGDGSPLGAGATQLWAVANAKSPIVLHGLATNSAHPSELSWSQISSAVAGPIADVAAEPGSEAIWLSVTGEAAAIERLDASGEVEREQIPAEGEPIGFHGYPGAIACPAPHDCWLATEAVEESTKLGELPGWLFHFTDGTRYPLDTDPNFAGVIASRPPDEGLPVIPPIGQPEDDSLANQLQPVPPTTSPPEEAAKIKPKRGKPLVTHIKSRFLHRRVLVISFTLDARAHVQLIGRRGGKVVASTRNESLRPGRHRLSLTLDPARWPKKLQFKATPIGAQTHSGESSSGSGGDNTIGT